MKDRIKNILQAIKGNPNNSMSWFVKILILVIVIKIAFFNQSFTKVEYINPLPQAAEIAVQNYRIIVLEKKDSLFTVIRNETINRIDSMPNDSVRGIITDYIYSR